MSDLPKGGDVPATRVWLDKKGFVGMFNGWEVDAILGLTEEKIMSKVPGERGEMLWGLLNTARQTTSKKASSVFFHHFLHVLSFSCDFILLYLMSYF